MNEYTRERDFALLAQFADDNNPWFQDEQFNLYSGKTQTGAFTPGEGLASLADDFTDVVVDPITDFVQDTLPKFLNNIPELALEANEWFGDQFDPDVIDERRAEREAEKVSKTLEYGLSAESMRAYAQVDPTRPWEHNYLQSQLYPDIPQGMFDRMVEIHGLPQSITGHEEFKIAQRYYKDLTTDPLLTEASEAVEDPLGSTRQYLKSAEYYANMANLPSIGDGYFPDTGEYAEGTGLLQGMENAFNYLYQNQDQLSYYDQMDMLNYEDADVLYIDYFLENDMLDDLERVGSTTYALELGADVLSGISGEEVLVNDFGELVGNMDWTKITDAEIDAMEKLGWIDPQPKTAGGGWQPSWGGGGYPSFGGGKQQRQRRNSNRRGGLRLTAWRI